MGLKSSKIEYPPQPVMVNRLQFIERIKDEIPVAWPTSPRKEDHLCPFCKKGVVIKMPLIGYGMVTSYIDLQHLDTCDVVKQQWIEFNKEQRQAMVDWVETVNSLKSTKV
jgi:hypothetical protein